MVENREKRWKFPVITTQLKWQNTKIKRKTNKICEMMLIKINTVSINISDMPIKNSKFSKEIQGSKKNSSWSRVLKAW